MRPAFHLLLIVEAKSVQDLTNSAFTLHVSLYEALEGQITGTQVLDLAQTVLNACECLIALLLRSVDELHDSLMLVVGPLRH